MAQTSFTPILIYSSSTSSQAPAAGNLTNSTLGSELAINITDGKLFFKDNVNAVQVIAWKITPTTAGGTGLTSYSAGDLIYYASGSTFTKLAIGSAYQHLGVNAAANAPEWQPSANSVLTTQGDLLYASAANTLAKLAIGVANTVLTSSGTAPQWSTAITLSGNATAAAFIPSGSTIPTNGMYLPASNSIAFATNSALSLRIFSNQHAAINNNTDNGWLTVTSNQASTFAIYASVTASTSNESTAVSRFTKSSNTSTTGQVFMEFTINNDAAGSGQINANGASQAAFGSFSDKRLKKNIVDLPPQLDNIMALRPVEFDYIESEGGGHQISFVAQEFEEIYPDAVGERKDGMKTLTGWGKTETRLVKAIQELKKMVDDQQAIITKLIEVQK